MEQLGVLRKNGVSASFYRRSSGMKDKDERSRKPKTHHGLFKSADYAKRRIPSDSVKPVSEFHGKRSSILYDGPSPNLLSHRIGVMLAE